MADRDVFAEVDAPLLLHAVKDAIVLHVGVGANANFVDVSAYDGIHPHRGMFAEHDVTDDLRRVVNVAGGWNGRPDAFVGSNHAVSERKLKIPRVRGRA